MLPVDYEIPGVFQGINKKIQDPKVVNFTLIFFRTSYLQKKKGPKKYSLILQLRLRDKFKEFSRSLMPKLNFQGVFQGPEKKNFKNPGTFQEF